MTTKKLHRWKRDRVPDEFDPRRPRWVARSFRVLFENTFLANAIKHTSGEIREVRHTSETKRLSEALEDRIAKQAAELESVRRSLEIEIAARRRLQLEARVISEVVLAVATTDDLDQVLGMVHELLRKRLVVDNCYVALSDAVTNDIHMPFFVDKFDTIPTPSGLGKGLTNFLIGRKTAMLLRAEDIHALEATREISIGGTRPAVWLGVPLRTPHGIIGALVVQHYEDASIYDHHDVAFLSSIADHVALALERRRTQEERLQSENQFRDMFDNAPVAYHELDSDGRYTRINRTEELLLGYTNDELKGRYPWEFIVEDVSRGAIADKLAGKVPLRAVERTFIRKDGRHISVLNEDRLIFGQDGKVVGIRSTLQDITALKALEKQLTHQTLHDPLTKLGNRVLFSDRVQHAIDRVERSRACLAVMFLDLDGFKSVNDSLGHAAGDELLVSVTDRLKSTLRVSDTPARLGGDEFAVLLEDLEHADQAALIAERIRLALRAPFEIAGTEVFISTSIGVVITAKCDVGPKDLLRDADAAMYLSKNRGRDRYTISENGMQPDSSSNCAALTRLELKGGSR